MEYGYTIQNSHYQFIQKSAGWLNNDEELKLTAFHEVTEGVLLGKLLTLARYRYTTSEEISEAGHEIVAVLENTVYKDIRKIKDGKSNKGKHDGKKT